MARNKSELFTLLLMPFVLIVILGFALRGLFGGESLELNLPVAIVQEDDVEVGIGNFVQNLHDQGFQEEFIGELSFIAEEVNPIKLLKNLFLEDSLRDIIVVSEMDEVTAKQQLISGDIAAILIIPENFTYQSLNKILLDEGTTSEIQVMFNDYSSFYANIINDIMNGFVRKLNFETAIAQAYGEGTTPLNSEGVVDIGGLETVSSREPVSSFQYYTIGMAMMYVLMVGGTIASMAYTEKKQQVFNRILLSGKPAYKYLGGKIISATVIAFLQLAILFTATTMIFGVFSDEGYYFWVGMVIISAVVSICVGGFAGLLTALALRYNTEAISAVFSGGIVSLFAFVGGSFFPTSEMPAGIAGLGNWTPNGAALTAYLQWLQALDMNVLMSPLSRILGLTIILMVLSIILFPKRRSMSS